MTFGKVTGGKERILMTVPGGGGRDGDQPICGALDSQPGGVAV